MTRLTQKQIDADKQIRREFEAEGYEILSPIANRSVKLLFRCSKGHEHGTYYCAFKRGSRCGACHKQSILDQQIALAETVLKKAGYKAVEPLQQQYKDVRSPINVVCAAGHEQPLSLEYMKQAKTCAMCLQEKAAQKRKFNAVLGLSPSLSFSEYVKAVFSSDGYTLLDQYKNSAIKMRYRCPSGHEHSISWANFSKGKRCAHCAGQIVTEKQVDAAFKEKGFVRLSPYLYSNLPMQIHCANGHEHTMSWDSFKMGHDCAVCKGLYVTHEDVKKLFEARGYTLLSRYEHSKAKVKYRCSVGHEHAITTNSFNRGAGCPYCANKRVTPEEVQAHFEARGYTLLSTYTNNKKHLRYICPKGTKGKMTWANFRKGRECPCCADWGGFNQSKPGTLYYIAFDHPEFPTPLYKIGITNRTVQERFAPEPTPYRIIHTESYLFGFLAYEKEQRILAQHAAHKYTGANLLVSGNTELFTSDILNLDKASHKQSPLHDRRSA
jgi:hypothetical protein